MNSNWTSQEITDAFDRARNNTQAVKAAEQTAHRLRIELADARADALRFGRIAMAFAAAAVVEAFVILYLK